MKRKLKIFGISSAVVIAVLLLLTAFTSAFPAGQRLLAIEEGPASAEPADTADRGPSLTDKSCDCLERTTVICDYLVPGVAAIQADSEFFEQGYLGRDTTAEEYEERLDALTEYCAFDISPGSWYGSATRSGGNISFVSPVLVCFAVALIGVGIGVVIANMVVVGVAIGMSIIEAMQSAGITSYDIIIFAITFMENCVDVLGG